MTAGGVDLSTDWSYRGLQALVLSNRWLRVVVLPELGGKVWEVHDVASGRQHLWHHPRIGAARVPFGATYDDVFHGGWDELFPNDLPEELAGEPYPDHGEVWSLPWRWQVVDVGPDAVAVRLEVSTPVSSCVLAKTLTLRAGERRLQVDAELRNDSGTDLPYLWKQHLALAVADGARIDLPAGRTRLDEFGSPRAGTPGQVFDWPYLDDDRGRCDLRPVPPGGSRVAEFLQALELDAGWCALTHADGAGIGLAFDPGLFSSCWVFASYGGWRNLQVAILEPCTGYPLSVADGVDAGTHRTLPAGEVLRTTVQLVTYDGLRSVAGIGTDGAVAGEAL